MAFELLLVPSGVALAMGLLLLTQWLESTFLSPQFLITRVVKVRNSPEHAERVVRVQADQLLRALPD